MALLIFYTDDDKIDGQPKTLKRQDTIIISRPSNSQVPPRNQLRRHETTLDIKASTKQCVAPVTIEIDSDSSEGEMQPKRPLKRNVLQSRLTYSCFSHSTYSARAPADEDGETSSGTDLDRKAVEDGSEKESSDSALDVDDPKVIKAVLDVEVSGFHLL
jgi:hypothetical protein